MFERAKTAVRHVFPPSLEETSRHASRHVSREVQVNDPSTCSDQESGQILLRKISTISAFAVATSDGSGSASLDGSKSSFSTTADTEEHSSTNFTAKDNQSGTREAGLQIYLKDGHVRLGYCFDSNLKFIHPNVYVPSSLFDVSRVGGGGSGVAVFAGTHPELGELVMKHGGYKDLTELFALATIAEELTRRGEQTKCPEAATTLQHILPSFEMIYISPHHMEKKRDQLYWKRLKKIIRVGNILEAMAKKRASSKSPRDNALSLTPSMSIRIYGRDDGNDELNIVLNEHSHKRKPSLTFFVSIESIHFLRSSTIELMGCSEYDTLQRIYQQLLPIMTDNLFKFTLAQQRIGGSHAKTGNQWLYEGKLEGKVLDNLVAQFCQTVRNLQKLTLPEERDIVDEIRAEVKQLDQECNARADELSTTADQFCGNAIKKNFHSTNGRLRFFRRLCKQFREGSLVLTSNEEIPAMHLGKLMLSGALMSDTFVDASTEPTLLQPHEQLWRNLLARAVDNRKSMSPNALKRIWNSGLADAGIHNLFVSENELYFFDLGVPQLQSMPGFMTKFLFSFFHTLGMQEDEKGDWIRRFAIQGDKLALTPETKDLLEAAYDAFEIALNGVIDNLFDGDQGLRWLLLQYVTLQLLSDAAFCLQRWDVKGGGRPRHDNHNTDLEKWLWRALWDCYMAFDINTVESWIRFDVEHPNYRDSADFARLGICQTMRAPDFQALQYEIRRTNSKHGIDSALHGQRPKLRSKSSFSEISLRNLTLSTYNPERSSPSVSLDRDKIVATIESSEESFPTDSDDDSAIVAPGVNL